MKRLTVLFAVLVFACTLVAQASPGVKRPSNDARVLLPSTSMDVERPGIPDGEFPRVSSNQVRPGQAVAIPGPSPSLVQNLDPVPDPWDTGGSGTCVWNFKCTGGTMCALGRCDPYEGMGCVYCSGSACKGCK